jgi:hypothetical protein
MKNTLLVALTAACTLGCLPPLANAQTSLSSLTAATGTNTINNANNNQEWDWNSLTVGPALTLKSNGTATTNGQELLEVDLSGAVSVASGTITARFVNSHSGTTFNANNIAVEAVAANGNFNIGVLGQLNGTNAGDAGVWGDATQGSGATYGVLGTNVSPTGYAGYFNNTGGGYAAAFMGGNVGIGTATPQSLLHVYGGEVQVGSSGASCAAANGGAIRFSGSTLYYCNGSSTWQTLSSGGSGTVSTGSAAQVAYYQSTGTTVIGTSTMNIVGGNVGIGTATPVNLLDIGTGGGIHIASGVPGLTSMALYNNSGTLTWNGVALATGSSVSGTANYIPVFTGASSLGNSNIYQSSGNVGIGTTTPSTALQVVGTVTDTGETASGPITTTANSGGDGFLAYGRSSDNFVWAPLAFQNSGSTLQGGIYWAPGGGSHNDWHNPDSGHIYFELRQRRHRHFNPKLYPTGERFGGGNIGLRQYVRYPVQEKYTAFGGWPQRSDST